LENATANLDGSGVVREETDTKITFRTRWISGITPEHRVIYEGKPYKIQSLSEIGRHVGLKITCERVGP
jgi:hypothetical protein